MATAAAQTQSNVATATTQAALNNANTYSPWGSSVWTPTTNAQGQTTYTLNQQLSPALGQLFGTQTGLAQLLASGGAGVAGGGASLANLGQSLYGNVGSLAGTLPTSLNLSNVPGITQLTPGSFRTNVAQGPVQGSVNANFPQLVQQAQTAAYQAQTQYLDPQWQQAESNLRQQLADQGVTEGSPAFSRAMLDFNNQKQQAYGNAGYQAVQAGNQQQQALFGESLGAGQFANQAQQQLFGQGLQLADLYNQAVLGAAGQQNTATQLGLQETQAGAQYPLQLLQGLTGAAGGALQGGLGSLGTAAGLVNQAPTWPLSIPTFGGQPTTVTPTGIAGIQQAATMQNAVAAQQAQNNIAGLGSLGFGALGLANQAGLFGSSGGLFSGGLLGALPAGGGYGLTAAEEAGLGIPGSSAGSGVLGWLGSLLGIGAA
jgi:hypothetical protein